MSGHSKWNNIKRKKEKTDGQRAKIFTKIGREMTVCVKSSGGDPNVNSKLRDLIAKAKSLNVPNDNIQRIIKKAEGGEKDAYESITYEGYGPSGIAMMVETLTDNRNRTAGNLRHYFDKFGGNMGNSGCVAFLFSQKGVITLDVEDMDEEKVMEDAFEAGAEDFDMDDGICEITVAPEAFSNTREALEKMGYKFIDADISFVPSTQTALTDPEDLKKMGLLLEHLEDDDDVQNVWHNLENVEDLD
ncbi:MAG: YebC/PmpR family DNA-binding transcriptional regulator [Oscillospiraceae bacterium]